MHIVLLTLNCFNQNIAGIFSFNKQTSVTLCWVGNELWDSELQKMGQTLPANMEGFGRNSHI